MTISKKISDSKVIMTEMIMPNDTNPLGNLMGGNLMRWMDIAAAICANRHSESYSVTVSVDHIAFHLPIRLGEVITIHARITRAFNTSMEVYVEVMVGDSRHTRTELSNHAFFSFVALDESTRKPIRVPEAIPETAEEISLHESAKARRELRLLLSGKMNAQDAPVLKDILEGKKLFV